MVALAAVAGAHGIKGEVRLKLFSDSVESLARQQSLYVGGAERRLLVAFATAARRRRAVRRDRRPRRGRGAARVSWSRSTVQVLPPLEDGEYYHADLIGLAAVDAAGKTVGTVVAVENYGAGDLLEIELDGRQKVADPVQAWNRRSGGRTDRARPGVPRLADRLQPPQPEAIVLA